MIAVYIIIALVLLVTVALCLDISLIFKYDEEFDFKIKLFCFTLSPELFSRLSKSTDNEKKAIEQPEAVKHKKKTDIIEIAGFFVDVIKSALGEFARYARLKLSVIKILVASDDAAQTALLYGVASSALYTVTEFLDSFLKIKKNYKSIGIVPDFTASECRIKLKVVLKIRIIHLLLAFIHILPVLAGGKERK